MSASEKTDGADYAPSPGLLGLIAAERQAAHRPDMVGAPARAAPVGAAMTPRPWPPRRVIPRKVNGRLRAAAVRARSAVRSWAAENPALALAIGCYMLIAIGALIGAIARRLTDG